MYPKLLLMTLLACLAHGAALADPIHARADGAYWHHDSAWIFPEKVGTYERVGIPQDVAGSEDAVAYYAFVENGLRYTASVDVYRATSAAAAGLEAPAPGPYSDAAFAVSAAHASSSSRHVYERESPVLGVYLIDSGDWRVRIRVTGPDLATMDAFARGQRWDTLAAQ